jgi:hypothetical protein
MEVSGQLHVPAVLPMGKNLLYPLYTRLGGPQSLYGRYGEEKNLVLRESNLDHPDRSPFLYRLNYPDAFVIIKLLIEKSSIIKKLYIITLCFYVYCVYWRCALWCTPVNTPSLGCSGHRRQRTSCLLLTRYNERLLYFDCPRLNPS